MVEQVNRAKRRICVQFGMAAIAALFYLFGPFASAHAQEPPGTDAAPVLTFLPIVDRDSSTSLADRVGYGATAGSILQYREIRALNAGWYLNWSVQVKPQRPAGIEFAQMVRLHQKLECPYGTTADRENCPYVSPPAYDYSPSRSVIEQAARANPGSIWMIGNEMDRFDWEGGRQDEMTPELYAKAYHELRLIIKAADPTAQVAIGGMIQFTHLRAQYLDKVWDTYRQKYGRDMPVDVWNIHNFIGAEICMKRHGEFECYVMGVPPGSTQWSGAYVGEAWRHVDKVAFDQQIRDFRGWMRDHGQKDKPLIISEYGVLNRTMCPSGDERQNCIDSLGPRWSDLEDPKVVADFMEWTFDYFANTRDCDLSAVDDCRLVQRWIWFSLEDVGWGFNPHTALIGEGNQVLTETGDRYSEYATDNWSELKYP